MAGKKVDKSRGIRCLSGESMVSILQESDSRRRSGRRARKVAMRKEIECLACHVFFLALMVEINNTHALEIDENKNLYKHAVHRILKNCCKVYSKIFNNIHFER